MMPGNDNARRERVDWDYFWVDSRGMDSGVVSEDDNDDGATTCLSSLSYPQDYRRLPQKFLVTLSVLKLDGSFFDIHIPRNAKVSELKQAIEDIFRALPPAGGKENISWSDVWDHFCLCYKDKKLICDQAYIRHYGLRDGDQVRFIRHMSISYPCIQKQPKKRKDPSRQFKMTSSGVYAVNERKQTSLDDDAGKEYKFNYFHIGDDGDAPVEEFKVSNCWTALFSLCGCWNVSRRRWRRTHKQEMGKLHGYYQPLR